MHRHFTTVLCAVEYAVLLKCAEVNW